MSTCSIYIWVLLFLIVLLSASFLTKSNTLREGFPRTHHLRQIHKNGRFDDKYFLTKMKTSNFNMCENLCMISDSCQGISFSTEPYECRFYKRNNRIVPDPFFKSWEKVHTTFYN